MGYISSRALSQRVMKEELKPTFTAVATKDITVTMSRAIMAAKRGPSKRRGIIERGICFGISCLYCCYGSAGRRLVANCGSKRRGKFLATRGKD